MAVVKRPGKDGKPNWYSVVRGPDGNQVWELGGHRKKNAEAIERRRKQQKAEGTFCVLTDKGFSEFTADWLDYKEPRVRPRTYKGYEQDCRNHAVPFFRKKKLSQITVADMDDYVTVLRKKGLSPRSINKQLVVLGMIFERAIVLGYLQKNPARYVERVRETHKEMEFLNPDEIQRFLSAVNPKHLVLFLLAILTGLRQGEIFGLRWSDCDLVRALLFVRRTYHPDYGFAETKTAASRRVVHLSPVLVEALVAHKQETNGTADDLIFRNRAGGPLNGQNLVTRVLYPSLETAGVKRVRFHDLRHTYAALMISMGANIKFIQRQMGHASIQTTLDKYGHLLPDVADGVGERLDNLVFGEKDPNNDGGTPSDDHPEGVNNGVRKELRTAQVSVVDPHRLILECDRCGHLWSPNLLTGGRLPRGYWKCPWGCSSEDISRIGCRPTRR